MKNLITDDSDNLENTMLKYYFKNPSDYMIRPILFPTKDGQVYYQTFIRYRQHSGQYSNKLYGSVRKSFNLLNVKAKNNVNTDDNKKSEFDFFNTMNVNLLEPYTKVKILDLLCTNLQKHYNPKVVYMEEAGLSYTHGVALLFAIDLKEVEKLYMYNLFDKDFDLYKENNIFFHPKEDALAVLEKYEFHKFENNLRNQERENRAFQNYDTQVMLSSSVQISNNETDNEDSRKSRIDKCFLGEKTEFKFTASLSDLHSEFRNAIAENGNSLKFLKRLHEISSLSSNQDRLDLILFKYCLTIFSKLKFLSCNYQYLADVTGTSYIILGN